MSCGPISWAREPVCRYNADVTSVAREDGVVAGEVMAERMSYAWPLGVWYAEMAPQGMGMVMSVVSRRGGEEGGIDWKNRVGMNVFFFKQKTAYEIGQ